MSRSFKTRWAVFATCVVLALIVATGGISRRMVFAAENALHNSTNDCRHSSPPVTVSANPAAFENDRAKAENTDAEPVASCYDQATQHLAHDRRCRFREPLYMPTGLLSLQAWSVRLQV